MTKFVRAEVSKQEIEATVAALCAKGFSRAQAEEAVKKSNAGVSYWLNDTYQVAVRVYEPRRELPSTVVHLSIRRLDRGPVVDWRDKQFIKNQFVGTECEAVELYPAESRLVDCANQFHLWAVLDPTYRFPLGFEQRLVSDEAFGKGKQRPH